MRFRDRRDAGQQLAARLREEALHDPVILALPRGGVPVAYEIASALGAPLDVLVVRKVGAPHHREFGIGAIAEGDVTIADQSAMRAVGVEHQRFEALAKDERRELDRRVRRYRGDRALPSLADRDVVLVDDGLATGSTARAAIEVARAQGAKRVVLAVPVAPKDTVRELRQIADAVVCVASPEPFRAIGQWYRDFRPTTDDEVVRLLHG